MRPDAPAPDWEVGEWLNTATPLTLAGLRGKVVVVEAFQMLCPGCVLHGIPQAQRIEALFPREHVAVIGLHAVFEHHEANTRAALAAFLHEYRVAFPVGVDRHEKGNPLPLTMQRYAMRGTPTLLLIDREGRLRQHWFGQVEDLLVGSEIARLL